MRHAPEAKEKVFQGWTSTDAQEGMERMKMCERGLEMALNHHQQKPSC